MFTDILWRFLILETFVLGGLCRVCFDEHPQKQFCISELVLQVKFHEATYLPGLEIIKVFKGNIQELSLWDNRFLAIDMDKEFNFIPGKKYYLFGRNLSGRLYIKTCNGILPGEGTTLVQRRAFVKLYEAGCECIEEIDNYSPDKRCQWLFSLMNKFGKHCKWVDSYYYHICQQAERTSGK